MEELHVTAVEREASQYVKLFDEDDSKYIGAFFQNHGGFLKKPLLTKDDMKKFRDYFGLPPDENETSSSTFEQLFPSLNVDFQKKHDIVFTILEGQNRGYSGLMSMLSSSFDFLKDHPMLQPNSLTRNDYDNFLSDKTNKCGNPGFSEVQTYMNEKQKRTILSQRLSVQVRVCTSPVKSVEDSKRILLELQEISKSWSDEKKSSSSPSASTIMAKLFSTVHSIMKETATADRVEYNPHAVLANPHHVLKYRSVSDILQEPDFIDYCNMPTIPKYREICSRFSENEYLLSDQHKPTKKKPRLPYFLNCTNMLRINTVSAVDTESKTKSKSKSERIENAFYDASELSIMVTAPLFYKAIWEGMEGKDYNDEARNKLMWYLQKANRTIWNQSSVTEEKDEQYGVKRPNEFVQVLHDIQCLDFMMLMLTHALSASDENNLQPFVDIIQLLDMAEPHVVKMETSFLQYGKIIWFALVLVLFLFRMQLTSNTIIWDFPIFMLQDESTHSWRRFAVI